MRPHAFLFRCLSSRSEEPTFGVVCLCGAYAVLVHSPPPREMTPQTLSLTLDRELQRSPSRRKHALRLLLRSWLPRRQPAAWLVCDARPRRRPDDADHRGALLHRGATTPTNPRICGMRPCCHLPRRLLVHTSVALDPHDWHPHAPGDRLTTDAPSFNPSAARIHAAPFRGSVATASLTPVTPDACGRSST